MADLKNIQKLFPHLVVSRQEGERIVLLDCDEKVLGILEVVSIRGEKLRMSMRLPISFKILREELYLQALEEKGEEAKVSSLNLPRSQ